MREEVIDTRTSSSDDDEDDSKKNRRRVSERVEPEMLKERQNSVSIIIEKERSLNMTILILFSGRITFRRGSTHTIKIID